MSGLVSLRNDNGKNARFRIDARKILSFEGITSITGQSQPQWISVVPVDVLFRDKVLDVEWDKWCRCLRHATVFAPIGGAVPNKITGCGVHVTRNAVLRNGGPSTG